MSNAKKRQAEDEIPAKKAKKPKKRNSKFQTDDEALDTELGVNTLFSRMDNQLLADYLAQKTTRFGGDLSTIELSDLTISGKLLSLSLPPSLSLPLSFFTRPNSLCSGQALLIGNLLAAHIKDTSSWQEARTSEKLASFLEKFTDKPETLTRPSKKHGSPHTLIVAGAGLRAADLVRAVRKFQTKESTIAKLVSLPHLQSRKDGRKAKQEGRRRRRKEGMCPANPDVPSPQFAKHMKVEEQVKFLKSKRAGIAVGTPSRLMELIDNGALSVDLLTQIVVDASHIDQKKRGVLDMKDTMLPLAKFLARQEFRDRYGEGEKPLSLLFY